MNHRLWYEIKPQQKFCRSHTYQRSMPRDIDHLYLGLMKKLTVEKAQQDPHCPWSLTGVTTPLVRQSTLFGRGASASSPTKVAVALRVSLGILKPFIVDATSLVSCCRTKILNYFTYSHTVKQYVHENIMIYNVCII